MPQVAEQIAETENEYEVSTELIASIRDALQAEKPKQVQKLLKDQHSADVAEIIALLKPQERKYFIDAIRDEFDPEILVELEDGVVEEVVDNLGVEDSAAALSQLDSEDAVAVIEELEEQGQQEILEAIPLEQREELSEGLAYPEDSAGRLMSKGYVAIGENWNVGKVIDFLRSQEEIPEDFYSIFVVNKKGVPTGYVMVSRILRCTRDVKIAEIMEPKVRVVTPDMDQEDVAYMFRKYAIASAPVVDEDGVMQAVLSLDEVVDIIDEEAEEDLLRMGGVASDDLYAAYAKTAKQRFPWLFINLLTAIAASAVIAAFDGAIEQLVALAVLMPIVASMAGNAGTQTMTIAVRAIATKELSAANALGVMGKECLAAALNGLLFAAIVFVACFVFYDNQQLATIFALATFAALLIAALAGASIPLALARVGVDPAVASGVFLTTVTDMSAFFIFLGLAAWWLV